MNTLFVLMLVTATGAVESPNYFSSLESCEKVVKRIKTDAYCVEKKPVNIEQEMKSFATLFKNFAKEMDMK